VKPFPFAFNTGRVRLVPVVIPLLAMTVSMAARPAPAVQECPAARGEPRQARDAKAERTRKDGAQEYVAAVNVAQLRARAGLGRYVALHELPALPDLPVGFVPRLVSDQWGYVLSVKDLFDPCGYALFSDELGQVYEAAPLSGPSSAVATAPGVD
jgi:hypothetical protein